ncbi:hypothetical protein [Microbacterium sp.]|uniref:hypothetical protein n=1 Tax=Microbacterium sp. TaxID=51671 RepID=UPI0025EA529B|nr:hypothetical protein [Microbacterium sp.]
MERGEPTRLPFDARPLTEPADRAAIRSHVRQLRQSGRVAPAGTAKIVIGVVVGAVFLVIFGSTFVSIISSLFRMGASGGGGPLFVIVPIVMLLAVAAVAVVLVTRLVRGTKGERWWRLDRFAQANGMTWYPSAPKPPLPGMIFGRGSAREATDVLRGTTPRFVEFGNYRYTTGSGNDRTTHRWGYVAVKLSTPLPHIVLDATRNNALLGSNLPASFDKDQRLSLEGDFDQHFTLYCPEGYERDALYLFTPDIMARFIDSAAALDVEIVDDWMFLYGRREFSTLDPATWAWLFSAVAAVLDKFAQWERWRDDRLAGSQPEAADTPLPFSAPADALRPPPGVAPQGRRLKSGVPWAALIIVGGFALFWLFGEVSDLFR